MPKRDAAAGKIRIGVGGWTYEPWRGTFYPEGLPQKRELEHASRQLTSIEINGTYYGSQKPASYAKWHDETPDDFMFSLKAPRFAMNRTVLAEAGGTITRFFNSGLTELKGKLGPINWQFLPTKKFDPADFEERATYTEPHRYPSGSRTTVLVNGVVVVDDAVHTGALPGKVLRRDAAGAVR